ncbi:unnamed protein product [Ranitomeya imitator]|uniref:ribonuclease H n=1 Tax=Ranitomeya imitator TaxID=111125 RepID=A0ABN9KZG4_9NEOB|nr:unnamed protein product [Ranitomeya imitator]
MNKDHGRCDGGEELYILCEKVQKEDIKVMFSEGEWQACADFSQDNIHRQIAIVLKTPPYHDLHIKDPTPVQVCLQRIGDGIRSEAVIFTYMPRPINAYGLGRKRQRLSSPFDDIKGPDPHGIESKSNRQFRPDYTEHYNPMAGTPCRLGTDEEVIPGVLCRQRSPGGKRFYAGQLGSRLTSLPRALLPSLRTRDFRHQSAPTRQGLGGILRLEASLSSPAPLLLQRCARDEGFRSEAGGRKWTPAGFGTQEAPLRSTLERMSVSVDIGGLSPPTSGHWRRRSSHRRTGAVSGRLFKSPGQEDVSGGQGTHIRKQNKNYPQCAVCMKKLSSSYKKSLCKECTDKIIREEQPSLIEEIKTLIQQEIKTSLATLSQPTPSPSAPPEAKKRKLNPQEEEQEDSQGETSDEPPEEGELSLDSETVQQERYYFSSSDIEELLTAVRKTMEVEEEKTAQSVQEEMFGGLRSRKRQVFPIHQNIRDLVLDEWESPEKKLTTPAEIKDRFPVDAETASCWSEVPKVDVQIARVAKKTTLPFEDASQLRDPLEQSNRLFSRRFRRIRESDGEIIRTVKLGKYMFGPALDDLLEKASDKKKTLPEPRNPRKRPFRAQQEHTPQYRGKARVIVPVPTAERFRGFYSNLFVVPKKGGSVRPILDLKQLNKYVRVRHFRMESLRSIIASMDKGEYLASIDIQDAYLHMPIAPAHQRFLRFAIDQDHYQFVALPFGLATAPRVFTKVMAATMNVLHSRGTVVIPYLDDLLIKAPTFKDCELSVSITIDNLSRMGWSMEGSDHRCEPDGLGCSAPTPQGKWSPVEATMPINILEIRAILLALRAFHHLLAASHIRIQSDNATAVAYVNHQGGTRSAQAMREVSHILHWAEDMGSVLSAVHIPGVDNWETDFLCRQGIDSGEWSLHPKNFRQICHHWGTPDVDLMASHFNAKVSNFMARTHDPRSLGADVLVQDWTQFQLLYIFHLSP